MCAYICAVLCQDFSVCHIVQQRTVAALNNPVSCLFGTCAISYPLMKTTEDTPTNLWAFGELSQHASHAPDLYTINAVSALRSNVSLVNPMHCNLTGIIQECHKSYAQPILYSNFPAIRLQNLMIVASLPGYAPLITAVKQVREIEMPVQTQINVPEQYNAPDQCTRIIQRSRSTSTQIKILITIRIVTLFAFHACNALCM
ncbi:hypothetical protein KP509_1Z239800 [Ceratopteris richardii]|nr:hypothetical protein KP509_1Z239800 [Ceratopteris richardii]